MPSFTKWRIAPCLTVTETPNCQGVVSGPFVMESRCLGPVGIKRLSHYWNDLINTGQVEVSI